MFDSATTWTPGFPVLYYFPEFAQIHVHWVGPRDSQESSPGPRFKGINSSLWFSAFFMVQLSHLYLTTGKTIALTIWLFVGKVMSLLSNTLFRFVTAFLPRSKRVLNSWLQSPLAVILELNQIKSVTASTFSLSTCYSK